MASILDLKEVEHCYDTKMILNGLSFSLEEGRIGCLLGPSGSGKTTILRVIAGFEKIRAGEISIRGQVVSRSDLFRSPSKRKVGIVFQDYALFPHLTVEQNVAVGLRDQPKAQQKREIKRWLEMTGLDCVAHQYPHELSGGESQRVALARAMAPQPDILLLDEPFSNLDVEMREYLSGEVRNILKENQMTALLVTHDQHEAFAMADDVGVFNHGKIEQWGSPYQIYHEPDNRFVADFIGAGTFLEAEVLDKNTLKCELGKLKTDEAVSVPTGSMVDILLRPDDVIHDDHSPMEARVLHKAFRGAYILYTLELTSGQKVLAHVSSHHNHTIGLPIGIRLEADHVIWFPK